MSVNGWERDELISFNRRIEALETLVRELDARTGGLVRLGPTEHYPDADEINRVTKRILDSIPPLKAEPTGLISKLGD
jgi:hypothetical protein